MPGNPSEGGKKEEKLFYPLTNSRPLSGTFRIRYFTPIRRYSTLGRPTASKRKKNISFKKKKKVHCTPTPRYRKPSFIQGHSVLFDVEVEPLGVEWSCLYSSVLFPFYGVTVDLDVKCTSSFSSTLTFSNPQELETSKIRFFFLGFLFSFMYLLLSLSCLTVFFFCF